MYTRKQYMNKEVSHDDYYSQFGTHVIDLVVNQIGKDRILKSTDKNMNDIPLAEWDGLQMMITCSVGNLFATLNGNRLSLSDCVCIAKSAARLFKINPY